MQHAAYQITTGIGLAPTELAAVRALLARSNAYDGTELVLALKATESGDANVPLYILARAAGVIIGALELVGYHEIESTLIVAPEWRRQRVGRRLVAEAASQLAARGINGWLLCCDEAYSGGPAFAQALGGVRTHFEHRLTLDPATMPSLRPLPAVLLRPARAADLVALATITAAAFGDVPSEVTIWIEHDYARPDRRWFIATSHDQPVGSLRVVQSDEGVYVTAFGVSPGQQRRGYGRAILSRIIALLLSEGLTAIHIEVETDNAAALALYRSCGFVARHTYGYYRLTTT